MRPKPSTGELPDRRIRNLREIWELNGSRQIFVVTFLVEKNSQKKEQGRGLEQLHLSDGIARVPEFVRRMPLVADHKGRIANANSASGAPLRMTKNCPASRTERAPREPNEMKLSGSHKAVPWRHRWWCDGWSRHAPRPAPSMRVGSWLQRSETQGISLRRCLLDLVYKETNWFEFFDKTFCSELGSRHTHGWQPHRSCQRDSCESPNIPPHQRRREPEGDGDRESDTEFAAKMRGKRSCRPHPDRSTPGETRGEKWSQRAQ